MATETLEVGDAAAPGMPQLDFSTFPNQIFWLVVTLIVMYLILSRVALPRIASILACNASRRFGSGVSDDIGFSLCHLRQVRSTNSPSQRVTLEYLNHL